MSGVSLDKQNPLVARLSLWLVDDNEEFRQGFDSLLKRRYGFERIQHFDSAEAAIESLRKAPGPDVVLLDMKLPGMNGVTAVGQIKAKSPATRILMYSTYFDVAGAKAALASGASGYFTKNQEYEDVVAAVCGAQPVAK